MYTEKEARQLVIDAGHRLVEKKLVARTWGNISARISNDEFVITPSGRAYETLTPEELVVVKISDLSYTGDIRPSSEKGIHAESYKLRSDIDFIVHTHQFYASVLAADCSHTSVAPCAAYAAPGTKKLIRNINKVLRQFPDNKAFLMARHGALILGTDPEDAFRIAEQLESDSKKQFHMHCMEQKDFENSIRMIGQSKDFRYMSVVKDQYIMECCDSLKRLKSYIDDFAMIAGSDIACAENRPGDIKRALKGRNAVLVKGLGALCASNTKDDLEAVEMIVSKNAAAACYVRNAAPLSELSARVERSVYLTKYSKRKDEK